MNDQQIKIFLTVSKIGSFSAAEKEMHISKQAMLKQINQLEEEIGVRLLQRGKSGTSLTLPGEVFQNGIQKIARDTEKLLKACREAEQTPPLLRVGNVEHQALLAPVTSAFRVRYPDIALQQVIHPNHSGEWRVANGIQDVAETFRYAWSQQPDAFSYQPLTTVPYVAAMQNGHPLARFAKSRPVSLEALSGYETMIFPVMLERPILEQIRAAFRPRPAHLIEREDVDNQVGAAYECIDSRRILITANPFIEGIRDLTKVPLDTGWTREYGIIYRDPASEAVQKYVQTAMEVYS